MTQRDLDIQFVKSHVGQSFKKGIWIRGRVAKVELEDGRQVLISLPAIKDTRW